MPDELAAAQAEQQQGTLSVPFRETTFLLSADVAALEVAEACAIQGPTPSLTGIMQTAAMIEALLGEDEYLRLRRLRPTLAELSELLDRLGEALGGPPGESLASGPYSGNGSGRSRPTSSEPTV